MESESWKDSDPLLHVELARRLVEFVREDVDLVNDGECEVLLVRFAGFLEMMVQDVADSFQKGYDVGYLEGRKSVER